ncbi:acyl-CoA dehydrogenase [Mycobacterium sp. CBMA271]|uniref:acyl-CoA dehydrogenase n=1 Tax=unclassified Mycobacteroides TaxID=2618759 RepID=UPI0012DE1FC1|nr:MULTISPECIES: acyl-CoA dehydrogenase [unclassified Mycobacteroides]MUM19424.1 acyl-CoA dehydrogenase [Mycobacteroides sp. CBMA 326]MUM21394.1 acyl-CoA dehydrogenase [Mycobacteroides sp. CBMA 271]
MPIAINSEHVALADSAHAFVERVVPSELLHETLETPLPWPPPFWKAAADQGLTSVHLAESVGGQGFGVLELAIVVAEFGRGAVPGPFVPSAIASALISAHDPNHPLLADLASGASIATFSSASSFTATASGDGLTVDGQARSVPSAASAAYVVAPVSVGNDRVWVVLSADDVALAPQQSVDPLRPVAHVTGAGAQVPGDRVLRGLTDAQATSIISTIISAEAVGVARWATDTASEYAKVREQFGRPIGQFQGIKHKCATMAAVTERATAAVWDAARALDDADEAPGVVEFAASVAATLAPAAAQQCAQDCIQVHGGIGYTWEHDAHIYYRRALGLIASLGRSGSTAASVIRTALEHGLRKVDIDLAPETEALREEVRSEVAALKEIPSGQRNTAIAEGGWVLPYLPTPWGRAASPIEQVIISQEFLTGRVRRPQLGIATWLVPSIVAYGTNEQKQRFLPPTFRGEMIWCQLFSEPGAGSDLAGLSTKAVKVDGGWRLTGQKIWTSVAQFAHWGTCLARTDPNAPKHNGITYFLIDMKNEGVTVRPLREMTGGALFNEVFIDDVFVPDELVVGEVDRGWEVSRNTLTAERVSIGSSDLPFLASLDDLVKFAGEHELGEVARDKAGQLIAEGHAVRLLNLRSTLLTLAGGDPMPSAAVSKLLGMRTGQGYAEFVVNYFGQDGAIGDSSQEPGVWADYLLASRATTIYGGTSEVQLNIIAERLLGLPRDP